MAIAIKVNPEISEPKEEKPIQATRTLNIRKTLDGSLIIFDHSDIDVVISPKKNNITAFAKNETGDHIYATMSRLFDFLTRKGVIELGSVRSGNVFSSLEGAIPQNDTLDPIQVAILAIDNFNQEEKPFYDKSDEFDDDLEEKLLEPDEEASTEFGEIPHQPRKGTINTYPGATATYTHWGIFR